MINFAKFCCLPVLLLLMGCSDAEHAPPNGAVASAEQETLSKLNEVADTTAEYVRKYPYIFHLVQKSLWEEAIATNSTYFPPTYQQDGFTHATANPKFHLTIGNHFYPQVEGDWLCLRMSVDSLVATDVKTIFEARFEKEIRNNPEARKLRVDSSGIQRTFLPKDLHNPKHGEGFIFYISRRLKGLSPQPQPQSHPSPQ